MRLGLVEDQETITARKRIISNMERVWQTRFDEQNIQVELIDNYSMRLFVVF
jgi:hypothetical protein